MLQNAIFAGMLGVSAMAVNALVQVSLTGLHPRR
jgi:hypothetical protein